MWTTGLRPWGYPYSVHVIAIDIKTFSSFCAIIHIVCELYYKTRRLLHDTIFINSIYY